MPARTRTPSPTAADRIAAEGVEITLKGEVHRLRFGLRALRYLEREFDGIDTFIDRLRQSGHGADRIRAICAAMIAGLLHEKPAEMALDLFEEQVAELLDEGGSLRDWLEHINMAITQSFPVARQGLAIPKGRGSRQSSRGLAGTSSPRSRLGAPKRRSGR